MYIKVYKIICVNLHRNAILVSNMLECLAKYRCFLWLIADLNLDLLAANVFH